MIIRFTSIDGASVYVNTSKIISIKEVNGWEYDYRGGTIIKTETESFRVSGTPDQISSLINNQLN